MASEAFQKMMAARQTKAGQSSSKPATPVKTEAPIQRQNVMPSFDDTYKFYRVGQPTFSFFMPTKGSMKSKVRPRVVFERSVYATNDPIEIAFMKKEWIARGVVSEITKEEYMQQRYHYRAMQAPDIVDVAVDEPEKQEGKLESSIITGQSSSVNVVAPADSIAGQK